MSTLSRLVLVAACCAVAAPAAAQEAYRFTYRTLEVGEVAVQHADFNMDLEMSINQAGTTIDSARQGVLRTQLCRLTVLETANLGGEQVKTKVQISYDAADQTISEMGKAKPAVKLPVAGKTYIVERVKEKLVITDLAGNPVPEVEQAIVSNSTDTLGRPNPIARFFNGRVVKVGDRLRMPPALARELLGFTGKLDNASKFELTFVDVRSIAGVNCAVFETYLETKMTQGTTMNMKMKGRLMLEIDTCRAVWIELDGPVQLAEAHGPADAQFTVDTKGSVKMALRAEYPRKLQ
jgi:hypothetical protein